MEPDELKIANFQAMTDCSDRLTAIRMLDKHNGDEMGAVSEYIATGSGAGNWDTPSQPPPQREEPQQPPPTMPIDPEPIPEHLRQPEQWEVPKNDETEGMNGGIEFLEKFRMKNGSGVNLPDFETDTWDEVVKLCRERKQAMFLYLHDHEGDSCFVVDNTVLGEDLLHSFLIGKFTVLGLNVHSKDGKMVKALLNVENVPHMTILSFARSTNPETFGARNGSDITVDGLIEMIDTANTFSEQIPSHSAYQPVAEASSSSGFPSLGDPTENRPPPQSNFPSMSPEEEEKL